jgi:tetratricopeptide (TPR) repeat protein
LSWTAHFYIEWGNFSAAQNVLQKLSYIGEIYDNDALKTLKYIYNRMLLMKQRKLHGALCEMQEGIQFIGKTGFKVWLICIYAIKARIELILDDVSGSMDSLAQAEKIMSEMTVIPTHVAHFFLSRFALNLYQLEEAIKNADMASTSIHRSNAIKAGTKLLKMANKCTATKTEALKMMGVYYWIIGKQRKAIKWWRNSIREGQRTKHRPELSRTYFEVGKRLLEPKSKYKELDGIKADEYLEKARAMFVEMDLQWDLDELEKLKIQLGS